MRCSDGSASGNSRRCGLCAEYQEQAEPWQIYSGVLDSMPRGYRLFFAAAFGCLIAALLIGWRLQPEKPNLAGDSGYREESTSYRAGGADCDPFKVSSLPVRLRQRKADACAEAKEQERKAANNLIEARRAASAADASSIAAYQQAGIAAWGLGASIVTLFAAIAAAVFAERAAFHTKSSHEAYRAREKARLIPSVGVNGGTINTYVENVGPTQAAIHLLNSTILPEKPTEAIKFIFPGKGSMNPVAVKGGKQHGFGQFAIPVGWQKAYFVGAIIYSNIFDEAELLACLVEIDCVAGKVTPLFDGDWSEWESEVEKFRRKRAV